MTAAHCLSPGWPKFTYFGSSYLDSDAGGYDIVVATSYQIPAYATSKDADIGIVILKAPATVAPMVINTTAIDSTSIGTNLRLIGFGATPAGSNFIKEAITTPITSVTADAIYLGPAVCSGDSGGPGVLKLGNGQSVIAGVISGHDSNPNGCGGQSGLARVDPYASWIQDQINAAESDSGPDGAAGDSAGAIMPDGGSAAGDSAGAARPDGGSAAGDSGGAGMPHGNSETADGGSAARPDSGGATDDSGSATGATADGGRSGCSMGASRPKQIPYLLIAVVALYIRARRGRSSVSHARRRIARAR